MIFSPLHYGILGGAALAGSFIAAVTGFGGAAILLPILVHFFGVREAIPILTVAQLIGNGSRVWFNYHELRWHLVGWFAIGAVPMALVGGYTFAHAPIPLLLKCLGGFLIATVLWRHVHPRTPRQFPVHGFTVVGAIFGFCSALIGGVGPFIVPFFLAAGLVKGAFIGTEALATVTMHIVKLAAYRQATLLTWHAAVVGLSMGTIMIGGSWIGKHCLNRISERWFVILVEITLVLAGCNFLVRGSG